MARQGLTELQARIENFQFGAGSIELAQKIVAADPGFAISARTNSARNNCRDRGNPGKTG